VSSGWKHPHELFPLVALIHDTPQAEVNHKSLCRQFQLKNQQLSKAYKDIKAKFETLEQKVSRTSRTPTASAG